MASIESQSDISNGKTVSTLNPAKRTKDSLMDDICAHISTLFHTLILVFTVFMLWLCFKDNQTWTLITWHVFLYTLGWALLMTEGQLILTKDNIYSKRISHLCRVRLHWIIESIALMFSLAGFLCIFSFKADNGIAHFKSQHAICGFVSIIFCLPTCLTGICAFFGIKLNRVVKPVIVKLMHDGCGIVTVIMGAIAMILSLYSMWFVDMTMDSNFSFFGSYVVLVGASLWCILKPVINSMRLIKELLIN